MDYLVKRPNHVLKMQKYYQNDTRPLYWRPPRSRLYLNLWFTGLAVGLSGVTYGGYQLIKGLSPGLQRARAPFRTRNAVTGILIGAFVVGVWAYSIRAVKQDTFDDLDEEAKALLDSRMTDERVRAAAAMASASSSAATELASKAVTPTLPGTTDAANVRGVLASQLVKRFPKILDPTSKTLVWGAPPVDHLGRIGDRNDRSS
ncbi:hypothetical protein EW145_g37 [Phellinidium pouzarii]|uniref:Cytochrome c oxidase assembly factor 3 n=1 Tax=Phellinidium pouzarii TaxID=167371 RepID=A0A4S4LLQ7_9AGAM|nr:hypothetical protein EW145_g37 [Phellinidium pouzarii]